MDLQLSGRTVLVTGGSSGVGLATVAALLDEGARVVTCARDLDRLEKALADIGAPEDQVQAAACDVRKPAEVEHTVRAGVRRFGGLDGVVNNAGQSRMLGLDKATVDDFRDELDLKFSSVLNTMSAALPWLERSDAASVITINAVLARQPDPRLVTTSAARAGLLNLTKSMATEYAASGVRVNSVCLGLVDTGQWRRRYRATDGSQSYEEWERDIASDRGIALGRFGTADEVAAMVVTLLSPRASYVTGAALDVCGGVSRYTA
jgi:NAD(P)-dependent dehydrogenase (short-subunit alcohol dehydrogenase family)